jgi:hypothetical protein
VQDDGHTIRMIVNSILTYKVKCESTLAGLDWTPSTFDEMEYA